MTIEGFNAFSSKSEDGSTLGSCRDLDSRRTGESGDFEFTAEGCHGKRNRGFAKDILAISREDFMFADMENYVEIATWASARSRLAITRRTKAHSCFYTSGYSDLDSGGFFNQSISLTSFTRFFNDLAYAPATRTVLG
jgi:hypothetical protein